MTKTSKTPESKVIHATEKLKDYRRPDPRNAWTMDPNVGVN